MRSRGGGKIREKRAVTWGFIAVKSADMVHPVPTRTKSIVQGQKDFRTVAPKRLLQLSAAGEVFLEGTCPLSRCPQTAKLPAPYFRRTGKVGEKSDSFSRAERTRPLRPVSRLLYFDFGNVPAERFQRDFAFVEIGGHGITCSGFMPPLKGEVGGEAARRGQFCYKIKAKKNRSVRTPQSVLRTASSYRAVPFVTS